MTDELPPVTLEDAYALETPEDNRQLYARWAATYESEFVRDNAYVIPERVAEVFVDVAGELRGEAVLDIGCGTGLAAAAVAAARPDLVIDGVDISPSMLAKAAGKRRNDDTPLFRDLIEADLTVGTPIADDTYAGAFSSGTFTHGHLGPQVLRTLVRIGRSGCVFALGINSEHFRAHDFQSHIDALVEARAIVDVAPRIVEMYLPGSPHFGDTAVVAVFRRA